MASLGDCGGTLLARRWDERVARQPAQVRRALGELDEDPGFFQLRALGRSRAYPEPGDTFRLEPPCCPPLEGVVVNSHVDHMGEEGIIIVLVFAPGVTPGAALLMGVPPESLMLPPPPPAATSEGPCALLDAQHPDALALAARAEGADPACLLNGYAWEAMLPELLSRAGRPDLLRGLSADPEAGALALSYRGRGASSRAAELASLLNALVASGEEVLALVRSGKVDWDG